MMISPIVGDGDDGLAGVGDDRPPVAADMLKLSGRLPLAFKFRDPKALVAHERHPICTVRANSSSMRVAVWASS